MKIELFAKACEKRFAGLNVQRVASAARVIAAKCRFASAARRLVAHKKREEAELKAQGRLFRAMTGLSVLCS